MEPCKETPFTDDVFSDETSLADNASLVEQEEQACCLAFTTGKEKQAQALVRLARTHATFFNTPDREAFACIQKNGHQEIFSLKDTEFRFWLSWLLYKEAKTTPNASSTQSALMQLKGTALFEGPTNEVFIRLAGHEDRVYLDLANKAWEQIEIDQNGWRKISGQDSPVRFIRAPGMRSIDYPACDGSIAPLRQLMNIEDEDDFKMILGWLVGAMHPKGPFPVLLLQGEQGSTKSTTARLIRNIIDPSSISLRTLPRSERDLAIAANKAWVLNFDNLSYLDPWLSDALCRVATGGGLATRSLFSNDSETIFNIRRPVIMNGISDIAYRHDLADRCLIIHLPPIKTGKRIAERDFQQHWNSIETTVRAGLLDAVSAALRNIGSIRIPVLPRMADFAQWVTAAEAALPWETGSFLKAYENNRQGLVDSALEADTVAMAVMELVKTLDRDAVWTGTPTALLEKLKTIVPDPIRRLKGWPKQPNILSNRLRRSQTFLRQKGIEVERSKSGERNIAIRRTASKTVPPAQIVLPAREPAAAEPATSKEKFPWRPSTTKPAIHWECIERYGQKLAERDKDGRTVKSVPKAELSHPESNDREEGEI
jgi:hypothetical protein